MAQSIFSKIRTAVLGNIHEMLNRACDTPEAYAQYIRDLERALADLRHDNDVAVGEKNGIAASIADAESAMSKIDANITFLLTDDDESNDSAALVLQKKYDGMADDLSLLQAALTDATDVVAQGARAIAQLEERRNQMARNLKRVQMTASSTASKNRAAAAAEKAQEVLDVTGSIDSIAARINSEARTADAKFDRVFGQFGEQTEEQVVADAKAKAAIAARLAALKKE